MPRHDRRTFLRPRQFRIYPLNLMFMRWLRSAARPAGAAGTGGYYHAPHPTPPSTPRDVSAAPQGGLYQPYA